MPCYSPLDAYMQEGGGRLIFGNPKGKLPGRFLSIPCGQCIGCRLDRSVNWAVRVMHEASLHDFNSFVTLTYADDKLPYGNSLYYPHYQQFMRKVRDWYRADWHPPYLFESPRFFMCGEYGERLGRPHYHAALFGMAFPDQVPWRKSSAGFQLYRSKLLETFWPHGNAEVGSLTFESAAYVARYCCKKVTGKGAEEHYERVVEGTGEVIQLTPEFMRCSLKPGIGARWLDKFLPEVVANNGCILDGAVLPIPKYYLKRMDNDSATVLAVKQYNSLVEYDNSYDRLRARETVTRARLSFKSRSLE